MQLVSDLQQRPRKGRLKIEKRIVPFYDLCSVVQLTTALIHTVTTMIGASRTFSNYIIVPNQFQLTPPLVYKTQNCSYSTIRNIYAFDSVNMTFTANSINDVFVDHAIQMRLAIFVCAAAFVAAGINRTLVESNIFVLKYRNFYFWKDILSATELLLLAYVAQIAAAATQPAGLLRDYLRHCGVKANGYLPFVSIANLWVFMGVGYATYAVGLVLYLSNTLPKYGVMSAQEIAEYKAWLRKRRAEQEQTRALLEEAKKAHARLHMMNNFEFGQGDNGLLALLPAMQPTPPAPSGFAYPVPAPNTMAAAMANPTLPAPQLFGAEMMPMPGPQGPTLPYPTTDLSAGISIPYETMSPATMIAAGGERTYPRDGLSSAAVDMPRRRVNPNANNGNVTKYL